MLRSFIILSSLFCLLSCEEVIDIELNTATPKLVIEASIEWIKETPGQKQFIKLSLTTPFFADSIPPAQGALVKITDDYSNEFDFIENEIPGIYENHNFIPVLNRSYQLHITYDNENYKAIETFQPVVPIDFVTQINDGGFNRDQIEIKAYYTDPKNDKNFYFTQFYNLTRKELKLSISNDKFINGNQVYSRYSDEDLESGQEIKITNSGISESFYNYMFILLQQNGSSGGGPFGTQPTVVKGNCTNETHPENFPLGYFRLSEVSETTFSVE